MTLSWPAYRSVCGRVTTAALAGIFCAACAGTEPAPGLPLDLMRGLSSARIQPVASEDVARLGEVVDATGPVPALLTAAPARLTWQVRLGEHADLDATVALVTSPSATAPAADGVTVRIAVADERSYEELFRLPLDAPRNGPLAWRSIRVDLRAYSGWKFSLFYQPSRQTWNLIAGVDPSPGGTVAWRALRIQAHAR